MERSIALSWSCKEGLGPVPVGRAASHNAAIKKPRTRDGTKGDHPWPTRDYHEDERSCQRIMSGPQQRAGERGRQL